jgi:hypothetical protein
VDAALGQIFARLLIAAAAHSIDQPREVLLNRRPVSLGASAPSNRKPYCLASRARTSRSAMWRSALVGSQP